MLKNVDGGSGCGWMSAFRWGIGPKRRRHFLQVGCVARDEKGGCGEERVDEDGEGR